MSYFLLLWTAGFLTTGLGSQRQPRIIGGRDIDIEEAPWQVSLQVNGEHHCGGSVYSDRIIITAIKQHEKFEIGPMGIKYDIAVMKLSDPLPISNQVKPINLALKNPAPESVAFATGWGLIVAPVTKETPIVGPELLQGIHIYIGNFDKCMKDWAESTWMAKYTISAGISGQSGCQGYSDGPLVYNNTLVGVVSGGSQTCTSSGFYSSVAAYHKWLMKAIKSIS